jgi:hypothetical protein
MRLRLCKVVALVIAVAAEACAMQPGPDIHGGPSSYSMGGTMHVLDLGKSGKVAIAFKFAGKRDMDRSEFGERGHKGVDIRCERGQETVRFRASKPYKELPIKWEYNTTTERLVVNDASFKLPINGLGVVTFDADKKPKFEVHKATTEKIEQLKTQFDPSGD